MLDYGLVGNSITSALISRRGEVAWMCYPDFASPSVFASLIDDKQGGRFAILPAGRGTAKQHYLPHTNILETVIGTKDYSFRILDFFPRYKKIAERRSQIVRENYLVRIVEPLRGKPRIRIRFDPRLDYARGRTSVVPEGDFLSISNPSQSLRMATNASIERVLDAKPFDLTHRLFFALGEIGDPKAFNLQKAHTLLRATKQYWQKWVATLVLPEENREMIIRSALVLKLLTYGETGAIIAAPTTSIPEEVGSTRCFDYRYCWVRDAAYTVDALNKIGRGHEAKRFMDFILERVLHDDHIQTMYGINGETRLKEYTLDHLSGFRDSKPVRIGNAAYNQDQHDIYGEIIDVMYLYYGYYEFERRMSKRYWRFLRWLVNQIKFNWDRRDSGIWEFRGSYQHFTYSKLMCYIGMDRAVKLAQHFARDDLAGEWLPLRDEIQADLLKRGYDETVKSFVMYYGSKDLDASLLHMTYHEFLDPHDPRLVSTVKSIYETLRHDYLVQRYAIKDDFGVSKSSFTICSFWLVDALAYIGEIEKAKSIYRKLIRRANHLGLFSEDIDIKTRKLVGNFPQAYTHIAMINTSILLSEWSSKRKKIDWTQVKRKRWI